MQPEDRKASTTQSRVIVESEANRSASSKGNFDAMARRRFQDPKPRKEGHFWVLYYGRDEFENGQRRRRKKREKLAPADLKEREVRKIAAEFLRPSIRVSFAKNASAGIALRCNAFITV